MGSIALIVSLRLACISHPGVMLVWSNNEHLACRSVAGVGQSLQHHERAAVNADSGRQYDSQQRWVASVCKTIAGGERYGLCGWCGNRPGRKARQQPRLLSVGIGPWLTRCGRRWNRRCAAAFTGIDGDLVAARYPPAVDEHGTWKRRGRRLGVGNGREGDETQNVQANTHQGFLLSSEM